MSRIDIIVPHRGMPIIRQWRTADSAEEPRAAGVLFRGQGEQGHAYLLIKRAPGQGDFTGHWAFPGGGIEHNETSLMAACRECSEEIGADLRKHLHRMTSLGVRGVYETWLLECSNQFTPKLNHEHSDWGWFEHDKLPAPMHPGAARTLAALHQPY